MLYLPTEDLATLHTAFAVSVYTSLTDAQRLAYLVTPTPVANPVTTAPQIPVTLSVVGLMALLSSGSVAKLIAWPNLATLLNDINTQWLVGVATFAQALEAGGLITSVEATAILAYLASTVADPAWTATVPGPTPLFTLFGGKFWLGTDGTSTNCPSLADVAAAR